MTIEHRTLIRDPLPDPDVLRTLDCLYGDVESPEEPESGPTAPEGPQPITA